MSNGAYRPGVATSPGTPGPRTSLTGISCQQYGLEMPWEVLVTEEFEGWWRELGAEHQDALAARIAMLRDHGPALGRPTVDTLEWAGLANLKELRASVGRARLRVLFVFDPLRRAVLLVGGNKAGQWRSWYLRTVPQAERLYAEHLERMRRDRER